MENWPEFSRKKSRFSGKNSGNRGQVHLLLVDFRLCEVGIEREIERQPGADAVLHVDARRRASRG